MNTRQTLARIAEIRTDFGAILEAHPDGSLPDEVRTRADALEAEAARLSEHARRQALIDEMDRRAAGGVAIGGSGDDRFDELAQKVTAIDVINAQLGVQSAGASRAREVSQELEKRSGRKPEGMYWPWRTQAIERRTLGLSTGAGSNLIQTTVTPATIDILRNKSVVLRAGATVMADLVGNLSIPRLSASASVGWVADGTGLTTGNPTFDQVSFNPKQLGGITGISRQVLQQSSPDVARVVEHDLAALIATGIDQAAIAGSGAPSPTGILSASGLPIVSGGTNGLAISYANIQALIESVDLANALDGKLTFISNAKVGKAMRTTLRTTTDTASNFIQTDPNELAGYPYFSTQNVPANLTKGSGTGLSALIFGDISAVYMAAWSMLDILANPFDSTAYAAGAVLVRAMATIDINLRHVPAFAAINDIIAP